jgi:Protein of unknown function (DUF4238)
MHCTLWTEGVREIVSAENSEVKFIASDHPVTIYNHAALPDALICQYPHDPSTALKASQTVFPLTRDFCLILTNLECAQDPATSALEKRTFARNFRPSMVRTDAFIRERKLSTVEVSHLNKIIKLRARRYIAAGRKEWLYPERVVQASWADIRHTLLPPKHGLYRFDRADARSRAQRAFRRRRRYDVSSASPQATWTRSAAAGKTLPSLMR